MIAPAHAHAQSSALFGCNAFILSSAYTSRSSLCVPSFVSPLLCLLLFVCVERIAIAMLAAAPQRGLAARTPCRSSSVCIQVATGAFSNARSASPCSTSAVSGDRLRLLRFFVCRSPRPKQPSRATAFLSPPCHPPKDVRVVARAAAAATTPPAAARRARRRGGGDAQGGRGVRAHEARDRLARRLGQRNCRSAVQGVLLLCVRVCACACAGGRARALTACAHGVCASSRRATNCVAPPSDVLCVCRA